MSYNFTPFGFTNKNIIYQDTKKVYLQLVLTYIFQLTTVDIKYEFEFICEISLILLLQKRPEQIAEEKKLHLVEICKENHYFPNVIASPKECRKAHEISKDEILDFTLYCYDGKVVLKKKKKIPFYTNYKSHEIYLKKLQKYRNQGDVKNNLIMEYGQIQSFLFDKYPECQQYRPPKKETTEEENN